MSGDLGVMVAFAGGVLSFLSPCVLPLAPPYLAFLSGQSLDDMMEPGPRERLVLRLALAALGLMVVAFGALISSGGRPDWIASAALVGSVAALGMALARDPVTRRAFAAAAAFVAGLATVFVALGATASAIGQVLLQNKLLFSQIAGVLIFGLGLHFIGLRRAPLAATTLFALFFGLIALDGGDAGAEISNNLWPLLAMATLALAGWASGWEQIPLLQREARMQAGRGGGFIGPYVIGLAFAFGWTPCIGPILGAILALAGSRDSLGEGVAMLAVYAAGLGLPFLLAALFIRPFMRFMRRFRRHIPKVEAAMGALLAVVGLLMATGRFETLAFWLLETFPALGAIG